MQGTYSARLTAMLCAGDCQPEFIVTHSDGTHTVRLTADNDFSAVHVNGTLDELAAFTLRMVDVVRELTDRELAATAPPVDPDNYCQTHDLYNCPYEPTIGARA